MPPTKANQNSLKTLRQTFTEAQIDQIVQDWFSATIPLAESRAQELDSTASSLGSVAHSATAPDVLAKALFNYSHFVQDILRSLTAIRSVVSTCVPEIKQEDNLGVEVQAEFLKILSSLEKTLLNGKAEEGVPGLRPLCYPREYYGGRAALEEKLAGNEKDGPSKSTSLLTQLVLFDYDAALQLAFSYRIFAQQLRFIASTYIQNAKKIITPRFESTHNFN